MVLLTLIILNSMVSLASAIFAAVALSRPGSLSGTEGFEPGEAFYVRMYAARSIPFEVTAGMMPFWFTSAPVAWVLFAAALIQALDCVIAVQRRQRGMATGAAIGGIVHLVCGLTIL